LISSFFRTGSGSPISPERPIEAAKGLALAALIAFHGLNSRRLTLTSDAAYELVMNVASGQLDTVDDIAAILQRATKPWA